MKPWKQLTVRFIGNTRLTDPGIRLIVCTVESAQ